MEIDTNNARRTKSRATRRRAREKNTSRIFEDLPFSFFSHYLSICIQEMSLFDSIIAKVTYTNLIFGSGHWEGWWNNEIVDVYVILEIQW